MLILEVILMGVLGLIVGSFLNVVILRLHSGKQFVSGRSECPKCHKVLAWWENIPLVSWIILRGRCRGCKKPISVQYPLVELGTSSLFIATYLQMPVTNLISAVSLILWLYTVCSFIILAVYDFRWYLLPDKVLLPLIVPAVLLLFINLANSIQNGAGFQYMLIVGPLGAAFLFGGFFYLMAAVSKGRWMGGGDIKLVFVMGLLLGLQKAGLALLIAFNSAAIIAVILIALKRKSRSDQIPFGPFLISGTLVAALYGNEILDWYLRVSGLYLIAT